MPRYRFRWALLPAALIRRIARELQLDGVSAAALRKAYGTRPGDDFVRDAWPLLRDEWLAKDGPARRSVVTLLRERKSRSSRVAECTYPFRWKGAHAVPRHGSRPFEFHCEAPIRRLASSGRPGRGTVR